MRKNIIAGNWKMNKTREESESFVSDFIEGLSKISIDCEVVVCPPAIFIDQVVQGLKNANASVGAQDMWHTAPGAWTGEISGEMLSSSGVSYVILGHSERREHFGEDNDLVSQKVHKALSVGLKPIVCVGETLEEREGQDFQTLLKERVFGSLKGVSVEDAENIVIAYEPIWAIGTGLTATPEQAQEVHSWIRDFLTSLYGASVAQKISILYGGSVKPSNAAELIKKEDIDGALVGGASLKAADFVSIIQSA
ncbi:triose-phosphate isomerase [PVC group bacterium (ex Bugula neritina AB1)]|nr:triose-phosphate isomerase [PVC group bacterium (ex Bugula neritina AB1)]